VSLRHALGARTTAGEPAAAAIGHRTRFQVPGSTGESAWIARGSPESSAVLARMGSRNPAVQMPPLATRVVDEEARALVRAWIEEDLGADPRAASSTVRRTQ
jgi:mono/diheme cytochrome c family protein